MMKTVALVLALTSVVAAFTPLRSARPMQRIQRFAEQAEAEAPVEEEAALAPASAPVTTAPASASTETTINALWVEDAASVRTFDIDIKSLPGITPPIGFFDPANLAKNADDEKIAWYRSAELKHGRVAMLATVGWLLTKAGVVLPGAVDLSGDTFSSLGVGFDAWDNLPELGKNQIFTAIGALEIGDKASQSLMMREGTPVDGYFGNRWKALAPNPSMDSEKFLQKQNVELNNGRLAMIGIISFFMSDVIPGSVPFIPVS